MQPDITVVIPARNEGARVAATIRNIARARAGRTRVEFVVVDDASTDGSGAALLGAVSRLLEEPQIDIRLCRLDERSGTYGSRNAGASLASADVLFMTDAHVRFSRGWDEVVLRNVQPERILCGVTLDQNTKARGYGCRLLVPYMGATWNEDPGQDRVPVQIAPCHAAAMPRELFERLGGYDTGMLFYGGGEPEFSVRAWLHGAEVTLHKDLVVHHHFKPADEVDRFLNEVRPFSVQNRLRFGLLYLSDTGCEQLLTYYAEQYPELIQQAIDNTNESDLWDRRAQLERERQYPFDWFVERFQLRNEAGGAIV